MFSTSCFSIQDTNTDKDEEQSEVSEEKTSSQEKIGPKVQKALNQALIDAARERDAKQVAILLGKGAKAYSGKQEVLDEALLGVIDAALEGDVQRVEMLLDQEAATDPEKQKIWDEALLEVAEKGNTEHIQMLLMLDDAQNEVNEEKPSSKYKISPEEQKALNEALIEAAREGDAKEVKKLLGQGAEINCQDDLGATPLHWAAHYDHIEVVALLLKMGAKTTIHAQGHNGLTALHFVFDGFKGMQFNYDTTKTKVIIGLLVNIGKANVNAVDNCNRTAYWHARFFELGDNICKVLEDLKAQTFDSEQMDCVPKLTLSEREKMQPDRFRNLIVLPLVLTRQARYPF